MDEADSLLCSRRGRDDVSEMRRSTNLLLQRIDDWNPMGILIAASNMPELLDPAMFRRFDLRISMPDRTGELAEKIIMRRLSEIDMQLDGKYSRTRTNGKAASHPHRSSKPSITAQGKRSSTEAV
ncbi:AAA family ATPase [Bifidobacterium sp. SO1]|nr:AAA family ATPase [Bifidobacterium sp. SO1]